MDKVMDEVMSVMMKDVNKAFERKESLEKNEKIEEVVIVKEERSSGTWWNVAYTLKKA